MKQYIKRFLIIAGLLIAGTASATTLQVFQGGSSAGTFTAGLLGASGTNPFYTSATTTVTCSGSASCSPFTVIGNTPITINASGGSGSYPFTPTLYAGNLTSATSSSLYDQALMYLTGFISSASSTVSNTLNVSGLSILDGGILATASSTLSATTTLTSDLMLPKDDSHLILGSLETTVNIAGTIFPVAMAVHDESTSLNAEFELHHHNDTSTNGATMEFAGSEGSEASPTAVTNGDRLGIIGFIGHDGTNYRQSARLDEFVDGSVSTGIVPGRLVFTTANSAGTMTEALRITSQQRVGIATSTPGRMLSVNGSGLFNGSLWSTNLVSTGTVQFTGLSSGLVGDNAGQLYSFASSSLFGFIPLSSYDAWTHPASGQSATSSQLNIAGLLDTASSTIQSTLDLNGATVKQHLYPGFSFPAGNKVATTTTGTTTIAWGTAYVKQTVVGLECYTLSGTVGVQVKNQSASMNYQQASSTVSRFSISTNNSLAQSDKRLVDIGPMTNDYISCSSDIIYNQ